MTHFPGPECRCLPCVSAERERLEAEVTHWQQQHTDAVDRAQRAEAENERLLTVVEAWHECAAFVNPSMEGAQPVYSATALRRCWALTCDVLDKTEEK